jgi:hypothetical protein
MATFMRGELFVRSTGGADWFSSTPNDDDDDESDLSDDKDDTVVIAI